MLSFKNVTKVFKSDLLKSPFVALDGVNFSVNKGEIVGLLGANGAGKTTSIKIAMDFIRASSGEIIFDAELGKGREIFKRIGYLPERPYFYPHLTGREFAHYMGSLSELGRKQIIEGIKYWGPKFHIDFALDRRIQTYSKGMLQRLGFLCTLLHRPLFVILDEPLSGLDPIGRKELKDIIIEVNDSGTTVFFSSHIVSDVEEICHSVLFLQQGKTIYQGRVDSLVEENIRPAVSVRYLTKESNKAIVTKVSNDQKERFLTDLLQSGGNILAVTPERPSLEEIFYSVKSDEVSHD